jgi:DNA-directed RNA polymerase subunit RPC12/RpoP
MAESPIITCPDCSKRFKGKENLQGKKIRCPFCSHPFVVPLEDAAPARPGSKGKSGAAKTSPIKAAVPPAKAKPSDDDDEDNPNPYGVTHLDLAPRCPNCANEMESEKAVVCLHCGYNTLTRTWGATKRTYAATGGEQFMHLLPGLICATVIFLFVLGQIFYCTVFPRLVRGSWAEFLDHESLRMWFTLIMLAICWGVGLFVFNRLVLNPKAADLSKV